MTNRMQAPQLNRRQNSWYLKTGDIHHFLCKCGHVDQFINVVSTVYHPGHRCPSCGNTHYLDSVMFLNDEKVVRWSIFNWDIETIKTEEAWMVRAYALIPLFDYEIQKIRFKKVSIASKTLLFTGMSAYHEDHPMTMQKYVYNHVDKATQVKELVDQDLVKALCTFVLSSPIETIAWIEEESLTKLPVKERINLFSFFLKHGHLKEYDFFYWDNFGIFSDKSKAYPSVKKMLNLVFNYRQEKSIRKAYFKSYTESMEKYSRYNHTADYIFSRQIEDRNFLLALINIDVALKHKLFDELSMITVGNMIEFLKEHYTDKTVTRLFTSIRTIDDKYIVRDTVQMFRGENVNFIREHFRKVPLDFRSLHNEFIRVNTLRNVSLRGNRIFTYDDNDINAEQKVDAFEFSLPVTSQDLYTWSQQLHNCMYGYSSAIQDGRSIIYGVYKESILTYAVEIVGNKIIQALGKYNAKIDKEDRDIIDRWFKEVYIKSWMGVLE